MNVKTLMKTPAATVAPDTTMLEARARARMAEPEDLPVVEGGTLAGLVIARRLRVRAAHVDGGQVVRQAMVAPAPCTTSDGSIAEAARLVSAHGLRSLPVVERGALLGAVSSRDLLAQLVTELERRWSPSAAHALVIADLRRDSDHELMALARALVSGRAGRLTLLHVVRPPLLSLMRRLPVSRATAPWTRLLAGLTAARVQAAREQLALGPADVPYGVEVGDPVRAIVAAAAGNEVDLVVVRRGGLVDPSGLVALGAALPCPLVVVPDREARS